MDVVPLKGKGCLMAFLFILFAPIMIPLFMCLMIIGIL